ncbi:ribosome biogenesis GTP-binding protein YihA/YsxC [Ruminococcaceae bacterium OttesenSCG-928-A16]|nr:ribosome biogenesis GTP-binding protein YihA/YsxC [Ruminococcaceae bacterium OttesenSCG-928-A16]
MLNFTNAEFERSFGLSSQLPVSERPELVFSGRSNVGKSSLINKLCNRKNLARVSGTPGKTATINFYKVGQAVLVDLPGYGYAKTSNAERRRWDELINGYFAANRDLRLLVQLLDSRHAPSKDDINMLTYLAHYQIPFIVALTKADKLKPSQYDRVVAEFTELLEEYGCQKVVLTSAEKRFGIEELAQTMQQYCPSPED